MELFSVTCITCRAKLKVRHVSAIGQILPCPRCHGMVQIEAPPGWKPPVPAEITPPPLPSAPLTAVPADEPLALPAAVSVPGQARLRRLILVGGGLVAAGIVAFGFYTMRGDEEPPAEPLIAAAQTGTLISTATVTTRPPIASPSPTRPAPPVAISAAEGLKKSIAFRTDRIDLGQALRFVSNEINVPIEMIGSDMQLDGITKNQSIGLDEALQPAGELLRKILLKANPDGNLVYQIKPQSPGGPEAIYITTRRGISNRKEKLPPEFATAAPPPLRATATPTAPTAVASANPFGSVPPVPAATPTATKPPPAPAPPPLAAPPPMIDLAARLADKLPEVALDKTPLKKALGLLAQISTIRISYDWDSLNDATIVARPVTLELADVPTGEAIRRVLAEGGLTSATVGDQLVVTKPAGDGAVAATEYDVSDLVGTGGSSVERLVALVQDFVAPETWTEAGGRGTIVAAKSKLSVMQTPAVQRETSAFLDRLRKARGKTPTDSATTLTTRLASAREVLAKPVTMNFRPGAPLETVLAHLEAATGATLTIDYPALMSAGFQGTEPIGCSADKHPLADVLAAVCGPREWSWRVVGERTIDLSTREGVRRRQYVEFYRPPAGTTAPSGDAWVSRIPGQLTDEGWRSGGGRGEIAFDEPSGYLIVRQHQEAHGRVEKLLGESPPAAAPEPLAPPAAATPQPPVTRDSERTPS